MANESESIYQLDTFIKRNHLKNVGGPVIIFDAIMTYSILNKEEKQGPVKVQISTDTFGYGKIWIEGDLFNPETYHTEFFPRYQTYLCKDFDLLIQGYSQPKNYKYEIRIVCSNP